MPGVATAQLLTYAEIVDMDLDATQDVNFADVEDYGHRVVVDVNSEAINNYLGWQRNVGSARPSAKLSSSNEAAFKAAIEAALSDSFVDIDGVTGGLHFGTANLDTNTDPRKRSSAGVSANDIPMCFVLYKLYGSSSVATLDNIYNLQDAHGMLSNETVATAITESFKTNEAGSLDAMFRDLLAADPHRFFDSQGIPVTGIFETNADVSGSGSWNITGNDTIEVKLKLVFQSKVSRRGVGGREHNLSSPENNAGSQENQQTVINPSDYFYVRLQMRALAPPSAPTALSATAGNGQTSISFTPGSNGGKVITNYQYSIDGGASYTAFSPAVTSSPVTITGLTNGTSYNIKLKAVNIIGVGAASATVSVTIPTVPSAPTRLLVTAGDSDATVSFTAGSNGGSAITNYEYSIDGGVTFTAFNPVQTTSPVTISGLSMFTAYTIQLKAVNAIGVSTASASATVYLGDLYASGFYSGTGMKAYNSNGTVAFNNVALPYSGLSSDGLVIKYNTGGTAKWYARIAGTSGDNAYKIAKDSSGNVYTVGRYSTQPLTVFNSDGTQFGTALTNSGGSDIFVVKYNSSGAVQWRTRVSGTSTQEGYGVAVDSSGNVYVTGYYANTTTVVYNANDTAAFSGAAFANAGSNDVCVIKYDTNGTAQWRTRIGGTGSDMGLDLVTDISNNIYVIGNYNVAITIYNADSTAAFGGATLANSGGNDAFIVKYDTNGAAQWRTRLSSTNTDSGTNIAIDNSNNLYITGSYSAALTLYNADGTAAFGGATLANSGTTNGYVAKYDSNGTALWRARAGGVGLGIAVDASGNVYIAGRYTSSTTSFFNANDTQFGSNLTHGGGSDFNGGLDAFIAKYDTNGSGIWRTRISTSTPELLNDITVDINGNVYAIGETGDSVTTNGGPLLMYNSDDTAAFGGTTLATGTSNMSSLWIVGYDTNGFAVWRTSMYGSSGNQSSGRGIVVV